MKLTTCLFIGVLILYLAYEVTCQRTCPYCTCPLEIDPVCGKNEKTSQLRLFKSHCLLSCTNMCRKNKYIFINKGFCPKRQLITTTEVPITETVTFPEVPVQ